MWVSVLAGTDTHKAKGHHLNRWCPFCVCFVGYLDQSLALLDLFKRGDERGDKVLNGPTELPVHVSEDKLMSWVRPRLASIMIAVQPRHHFRLFGDPRLFPAHFAPANGLPGSIFSGWGTFSGSVPTSGNPNARRLIG